ncbi:MAG TPA: type II secretion system F family protein [Parvularculaceae bacterium]|nr:type II secretion system F family protein [Parvularculaceae bacterium]
MTLFLTLLLSGAAALGFFLLIDGVGDFIANTGDRGESRRLRRLGQQTASVEKKIDAIAAQDDEEGGRSINSYIDGLLISAHSEMTRERVYVSMAVFTIAIFLAFFMFARWLPLPVQVAFAVVLGVAIPIFQLKAAAQRRVQKFQEQFPDALDLIVRGLRIGHPISVALETIAEEMPDPIGAEFKIASKQIRYGKTPPEAILALSQRIPLQDLRFFSVAIQIHHEAGGNLAEILTGLSKIIRSRFQLFRKVKALTVEGRFSAWFLSLFPVVMIFAMNGLQPGYYDKVSDFAYFPQAIALTVVLLLANVIAMRMITKLEV